MLKTDSMNRACDSIRSEIGAGRVASYIPALASVDPKKFGAAIVTVDGHLAKLDLVNEPGRVLVDSETICFIG